jgi:cytochrome c-type biogenesis protein
MDTGSVTIPLAFLAGLLSFVSPCVMPLIPAYIGYLSGVSLVPLGDAAASVARRSTFLNALAFVLGFSAVFIFLGASVAFLGNGLYRYLPWIQKVGGVIIVLFGLHTMGLVRIPFLYYQKQLDIRPSLSLGYLSSALMGVIFSAGWVPCVGPILAAILFLASSTQTVGQGAFLLAVYSLGLGIPFLLTGAAFTTVSGWLRRLNRYLSLVSIVSGGFLVAIGILVFTDSLRFLSGYGPILDIGIY